MIAICWSLVGAMVCQLGIVLSVTGHESSLHMVISLYQRMDVYLM